MWRQSNRPSGGVRTSFASFSTQHASFSPLLQVLHGKTLASIICWRDTWPRKERIVIDITKEGFLNALNYTKASYWTFRYSPKQNLLVKFIYDSRSHNSKISMLRASTSLRNTNVAQGICSRETTTLISAA